MFTLNKHLKCYPIQYENNTYHRVGLRSYKIYKTQFVIYDYLETEVVYPRE